MSLSAPARAHEIIYDAKNTETLINEIKNRPTLWDKFSRNSADRGIRTLLWHDICEAMIPFWSELNLREKTQIRMDVQKKWRNLRDSFGKELSLNKKVLSGEIWRKKKPYIYYDALSFLNKQFRENKDTTQTLEESEDDDSNNATEENVPLQSLSKKRRLTIEIPDRQTDGQYSEETEENIVDTPIVQYDNKIYDEVISFSEMLVPMMRKLNEDQLHFAKVEILNILHKAKKYRPVQETFSDPLYEGETKFNAFSNNRN